MENTPPESEEQFLQRASGEARSVFSQYARRIREDQKLEQVNWNNPENASQTIATTTLNHIRSLLNKGQSPKEPDIQLYYQFPDMKLITSNPATEILSQTDASLNSRLIKPHENLVSKILASDSNISFRSLLNYLQTQSQSLNGISYYLNHGETYKKFAQDLYFRAYIANTKVEIRKSQPPDPHLAN